VRSQIMRRPASRARRHHGLRIAADHSDPRARRLIVIAPDHPRSRASMTKVLGSTAMRRAEDRRPTVRFWEPIPFATTPGSDLLRFTATLAS